MQKRKVGVRIERKVNSWRKLKIGWARQNTIVEAKAEAKERSKRGFEHMTSMNREDY